MWLFLSSSKDNVGKSATTAAGASAEVIDERSTLEYITGGKKRQVRTELRRFTGDRWFNGQVASGVTGTVVAPAKVRAVRSRPSSGTLPDRKAGWQVRGRIYPGSRRTQTGCLKAVRCSNDRPLGAAG